MFSSKEGHGKYKGKRGRQYITLMPYVLVRSKSPNLPCICFIGQQHNHLYPPSSFIFLMEKIVREIEGERGRERDIELSKKENI